MVALHPVQEFLPTLGVSDVLDAEVDTLLDVPVANDLVDDNTNGVWCHVVDDAGSSAISALRQKIQQEYVCMKLDEPVVVFVRHTLLLGGVSLDIDDITNAVVDEVCRQFDGAVL